MHMDDFLNEKAVGAVKKDKAAAVLNALVLSEDFVMVLARTQAPVAAQPPTGTGAVDPNPMKR